MNKLKGVLGYLMAFLAVPMVLATFIGLNFWSASLVSATGLKVSPWYTGGEIVRTIDREQYKTFIHRPIFDALMWEKNDGFVQIDWYPLDELPPFIIEEIDYDDDGQKDFLIELDSKTVKAFVTSYRSMVVELEGCYNINNTFVVRVKLRND